MQIDVSGPVTLEEASLALIAVQKGIGIGFFMEADVREAIAAARLELVLKDWTPPMTPLCLYYPDRRNPSAAFRALIEMARNLGRNAGPS